MKQFPLALIGLLCAASSYAAQGEDGSPGKQIPGENRGYAGEQLTTQAAKSGNDASADNADKEKGKKKKAGETAVQTGTVFREMVVTGEIERDSHFTSPSTRVTRAQVEQQNAQTTEEVLKYMPSLQIRQRYVGDPNGMLGIRGADMFSTARSMVYADGLPLHNFLQASFNGAPRWSLVGPNEIDSVDVIYGPFSAEYSGNSMGGVANIRTRMPHKQEFYFEGSVFIQPYENYGEDKGTFIGDRQYFSYGTGYRTNLRCFWPITGWRPRVIRSLISSTTPDYSMCLEEHR